MSDCLRHGRRRHGACRLILALRARAADSHCFTMLMRPLLALEHMMTTLDGIVGKEEEGQFKAAPGPKAHHHRGAL